MSAARDPLLDALRAARPEDPGAAEAERAAVRVLARVAVLEAGGHVTRRRRMGRVAGRRAVVAAAVLLACLVLTGQIHERAQPAGPDAVMIEPTREATPHDPWDAAITAALAGDDLARRSVRHGGLGARRALLAVTAEHAAARRYTEARAGLALLAAGGPLRGETACRQVAAVAAHPALGTQAVALLARAWGPYGVRELERLLVEQHDAEAAVVAALEGMAAAGRREAALRALLSGAARGRAGAVPAALRVGGAAGLPRVLAAAPTSLLRAPAVVRVVERGPVTLRQRVLRLAARGDGEALALAAHARVPGIVAQLGVEAADADPARARRAVALLAAHGGLPATLALARALDGAAHETARAHLAGLPAAMDERLRRHVRGDVRDATPVIAAFGVRGARGVDALAALAADARLAPRALAALGRMDAPGAADALARLAARPALASGAIEALVARRLAGDPAAVAHLDALVQGPHGRIVARALRAVGLGVPRPAATPGGRAAVARAPQPRVRRGSI